MSTPKEEKQLVSMLTKAMVIKLEANRDRDHWDNEDSDYFLSEAKTKMKLLEKCCDEGQPGMALGFAADVANFCAMAVAVTQQAPVDE